MGRKNKGLSRRDFLNGVAIGLASGILTRAGTRASLAGTPPPAERAEPYPPLLQGLRGDHDGSFEVAHALGDGELWKTAGKPEETGESFDLIVVGGGISGLSAAHFFRKEAGPGARILILDNHDDFGGHARRNEFHHNGRTYISYGGSYAIDSPRPYGSVARALVEELGIDVKKGGKVLDRDYYPSRGLTRAVFLDRETFGRDCLLPDPLGDFGGESDDRPGARDPLDVFVEKSPLPREAKADLVRLCRGRTDYMPGLSSAAKKEKLARMSYLDFLLTHARVVPSLLPLLRARTHSLYGVGIDAVPAQDAWGIGLPGFLGLSLDPAPGRGMGLDAMPRSEEEPYFFHFPDGNASVARLLVQKLIPGSLPGKTPEESFLGTIAYRALDRPENPVKVRLQSTAVKVENEGAKDRPGGVRVLYMQHGKLKSVRAPGAVLACWTQMIPFLCPDLPKEQKEALLYGVKVPLLYANVLIREWRAFDELKVSAIHAPGGYFTTVNLGRVVDIGDYRSPRSPGEPNILHLVKTPCRPGLPARRQYRAGRIELLETTFAAYEKKIRDLLDRMLAPAGFKSKKDVLGITINRWAHGYTYQYNSLYDEFFIQGGETPCERGRKTFGRIAIANADAAAYSYMDASIEQAHRAVHELARRG